MRETAHSLFLPHLTTAIPKAAPADGSKRRPLVPIVEIDLTTTLRFSAEGVSSADAVHAIAGVLSLGSLMRELPAQSGEFRISDGEITFQNADGTWGKLLETENIPEAEVPIKIGDCRVDEHPRISAESNQILTPTCWTADSTVDSFKLEARVRVSYATFDLFRGTPLPALDRHRKSVLIPPFTTLALNLPPADDGR